MIALNSRAQETVFCFAGRQRQARRLAEGRRANVQTLNRGMSLSVRIEVKQLLCSRNSKKKKKFKGNSITTKALEKIQCIFTVIQKVLATGWSKIGLFKASFRTICFEQPSRRIDSSL